MDYLKKNHLALLIIGWLVVSSFAGSNVQLGAYDRTTFENPITFNDDVTLSGAGTDLTTGGDVTVGDDLNVTGDAVDVNGITFTTLTYTITSAATHTPCFIKSPAATTTLVQATINITTGTGTASTLTLARGIGGNSTSTTLGKYALAANLLTTKTASSSSELGLPVGSIDSPLVFGPIHSFVVGADGYPTGFVYSGTCTATFRSVN